MLPATRVVQSGKKSPIFVCNFDDIDEDRRTAPVVHGYGLVPLSHLGNVITRVGIYLPVIIYITAHDFLV